MKRTSEVQQLSQQRGITRLLGLIIIFAMIAFILVQWDESIAPLTATSTRAPKPTITSSSSSS